MKRFFRELSTWVHEKQGLRGNCDLGGHMSTAALWSVARVNRCASLHHTGTPPLALEQAGGRLTSSAHDLQPPTI